MDGVRPHQFMPARIDTPVASLAVAGRHTVLTAIPYHLWANRGPSVMRVFVPARGAPPDGPPPVQSGT